MDSQAAPLPRRDFLTLATTATAAVGVGAFAWPFLDSLRPAGTDVGRLPIDVDVSAMKPGQQIAIVWRGNPVFITRRTPAALAALKQPALAPRLRDAASSAHQQPPYAANWHRSLSPEYGVVVGVCTHLGCVPGYMPDASASIPIENWPGGYACPCHGSKFDLAGRVFKGAPAPYNLPVPPHHMMAPGTLRVGENPPGETFDFGDIVQI
ncbi:ubiquinol-cytochrome c reductase iron-sulfur subunit [Ameyamaea chiangmaiensis NBRC 103196]|uniref:Ubiquinol-cytochrome c reductase iron-sulfur subunit n=1 Tax=Ameyamaea chiangmaiensis TaxID=442969 RepID=A0A850PFK3_9PROT|nr:ubiquinol-cytochrome c reductase iron-sulfur subunit [Ameyamaea chiangmaiensis]MBS4074387.1 ubiquinol-cytochrome c reductase iron-sulfur subunit [Ameyamaea chiangmaiensis]NVN41613.1 ubiquinol-cytochrome c reductase iron-sulfur subunit [Ameyamaea chiangmaiensis]GBQ71864.1 ubiquinol-cytochrome c reductase iron-sulfur subunit [Ameyamaea chiangmaiensis NBRC 103196]